MQQLFCFSSLTALGQTLKINNAAVLLYVYCPHLGPLADFNFWCFGMLSFVWTWVLSFFSSLVGCFFLYLFKYLFISHYSQLIHALVLSSFFFSSLVGCFFLYLFYLFNIIPNSYMPLYSLYFAL